MKLKHYYTKLSLFLKEKSLKEILKELFFLNRKMVVIEKEIQYNPPLEYDEELVVEIVDKLSIDNLMKKYDLEFIKHYCKKGATCLALFKNNVCVGYQFWTQDNMFKDLIQLELTLKSNEVYMFDLYVFPEYRGTKIPKILSRESLNYLSTHGIDKIYGFYFSDNIKAAWWHKAYFICNEIKHVKIHKILFLEYANGHLMFNI